ncbi:membrane-bound metal-dependent hydrolase [Natranaerobius thermophilus JW/NM-WN-LF]|uniref:Membrane-bound metal-dependent hydrolase n=1 Tax=Natranaerobius thermophilus (strain ATCC BAA-1301 / DSM 18059 / JW/NM-WN-LF) TaxID=457570 RepID=B2A8M6_NATTJ|nr:membrane-bound metal-dependent hydrolase [Natranaerobius thermophilus JW/NM-WN-LF]
MQVDPVTHLVVNTGIYTAVSDKGLSLDNPELLVASVGALIPDGDAIFQIFGHIPYLKNHRGVSHSILGGLFLSALTAMIFSFIFAHSFFILWAYGMLGVSTHLFLDWCNSYGVKLFWPLSSKMYSGNLLVVIEPILVALSLIMIFSFSYSYAIDFSGYTGHAAYPGYVIYSNLGWIALGLMAVYLFARYISRVNFTRYLKANFSAGDLQRLVVLPASTSLFHWDFIAETSHSVYIGQAPIFRRVFWIKEKLSKKIEKEMDKLFVNKALNSKIGKLFREFTPYYLVKHKRTPDDKHLVIFIDLRYHMGKRFLHQASVRFKKQGSMEEALFHPYHPERKIPVD